MSDFATDLLRALSTLQAVTAISLESEGPIVRGRATIASMANAFLEVYHNSRTQTTAFALVVEQRRIWGVDRDRIRGWHLHPLGNPEDHMTVEPLSVAGVIALLPRPSAPPLPRSPAPPPPAPRSEVQ